MTEKLEALLGNLFVVGGRAISSAPPGSKIQLAPRRAHRSRENDTLFVLVTPAGHRQAQADFYEKLAQLAIDRHFRSRVSTTGALREVIQALHEEIRDYNQRHASDYRAAVLLMVKRHSEVFLVRAGTTIVIARLNGQYVTFPSDPEMLNILPLGSKGEPTAEYTYHSIGINDLLVLGDGGVASLSDTVLKSVILSGNIEDVLDKLEGVVEQQGSAMLVQFVSPETEAVEETVADPIITATTTDLDRSEKTVSDPMPATGMDLPVPMVEDAKRQAMEIKTPFQPSSAEEQVAVLGNTTGGEAGTKAAPFTLTQSLDERAAATNEVVEAQGIPITPKREKVTTDSVVKKTTTVEMPATTEKTGRVHPLRWLIAVVLLIVAGLLGMIAKATSMVLNRLLPEPTNQSQEAIPMNVAALIAVIIPALVGIVVVGLVLSNQDNTNFEELRAEALSSVEDARTVDQIAVSGTVADEATACQLWNIALQDVMRALQEFPRDGELTALGVEAQNKINYCDRIELVNVLKLRDFGNNSDLRGPILGPDQLTLYILDRTRDEVYRDEIRYTGSLTEPSLGESGGPIIYRAMRIQEYVVAGLVDIEWMDSSGGAARNNALVALDENGLLISYVGGRVEALRLEVPELWKGPIAIATFQDRFYVLDREANQIWRFEKLNGFYGKIPDEYFTSVRPDLSKAVDFTIDQRGAIYILFSDGRVEKYYQGAPETFAFEDGPPQGYGDTRAIFADNDPVAYAVYMVDRRYSAVYQLSQAGTRRAGYRPTETDIFDQVNGVYTSVESGITNVYVVSGNSLYYFSR